jgi:hypothetical protein
MSHLQLHAPGSHVVKPKTWAEWDEMVDRLRTDRMQGDFARGQRAPESHRDDGKVFVYIGTFARGMRRLPPERVVG